MSSLTSASLMSSACASVLTAMNSTPLRPASIIRLTALHAAAADADDLDDRQVVLRVAGHGALLRLDVVGRRGGRSVRSSEERVSRPARGARGRGRRRQVDGESSRHDSSTGVLTPGSSRPRGCGGIAHVDAGQTGAGRPGRATVVSAAAFGPRGRSGGPSRTTPWGFSWSCDRAVAGRRTAAVAPGTARPGPRAADRLQARPRRRRAVSPGAPGGDALERGQPGGVALDRAEQAAGRVDEVAAAHRRSPTSATGIALGDGDGDHAVEAGRRPRRRSTHGSCSTRRASRRAVDVEELVARRARPDAATTSSLGLVRPAPATSTESTSSTPVRVTNQPPRPPRPRPPPRPAAGGRRRRRRSLSTERRRAAMRGSTSTSGPSERGPLQRGRAQPSTSDRGLPGGLRARSGGGRRRRQPGRVEADQVGLGVQVDAGVVGARRARTSAIRADDVVGRAALVGLDEVGVLGRTPRRVPRRQALGPGGVDAADRRSRPAGW